MHYFHNHCEIITRKHTQLVEGEQPTVKYKADRHGATLPRNLGVQPLKSENCFFIRFFLIAHLSREFGHLWTILVGDTLEKPDVSP